jgi:hypothetical protein
VKGTRFGRGLSEKIVSLGMGIVASTIFRRKLTEINAQPKVFHRSLLERATNPPIDFNFDVYMLVKAKQAGYRIETISVQFPPRQYGHSNWAKTWKSKIRTIWRSVKYMTRLAIVGDAKTAESRGQKAEQASTPSGGHGIKRPHLLDSAAANNANRSSRE